MSSKHNLYIGVSLSAYAAMFAPAAAEVSSNEASEIAIDARGVTRIEDYLEVLPQFVGSDGARATNSNDGSAHADLRGLGAANTLILINGRRLPYGSSRNAAPDLNQIPIGLIERVDWLTGGASAIYGSGAVAGVVNFITKKNINGILFEGRGGAFQHSNGGEPVEILNAQNIPFNGDNSLDGEGADLNLIAGVSSADGRGNITAYVSYRNDAGVRRGDRDHSACQYVGGTVSATTPFGFRCGFTTTTLPNGLFFTDSGIFTLDESGSGNTFRPFDSNSDFYTLGAAPSLSTEDQRVSAGGFAEYEFDKHATFYAEAMYYNQRARRESEYPSAAFFTSSINCDNPLLSAQQGAIICGGAFGTPVSATFYPSKRFVEAAPRALRSKTENYRIVGGFRGEIAGGWSYDGYFQYADTNDSRRSLGEINFVNLRRSVDVIDVGGTPECRAAFIGVDPACAPLDIFSIGGVSDAALDYILTDSEETGGVRQYIGSFQITGSIFNATPWSDEEIGLAAGFEWRKDRSSYVPDQSFAAAPPFAFVQPPFAAVQRSTDFFAEANAPLITDWPLAKRFDLNLAYRHINPSVVNAYSAWRIGVDWALSNEFRLRGAWNRTGRTPDVFELFGEQATFLSDISNSFDGDDPCSGATPAATLAQCANSGVTAANYGFIPRSPSGFYNVSFGSNPSLRAERSDSWTIGSALTFGELSVQVDYFDIKINDAISEILPGAILDACLTSGDPDYCGRIDRDSFGSLWLNGGSIDSSIANSSSRKASGLDFEAEWRKELGKAGSIEFNYQAALLFNLETNFLPFDSVNAYDCAGIYAGRCGAPVQDYKHIFKTTWNTPLGVGLSAYWRRLSSVDRDGVNSPDPAVTRYDRLEARNYIDLAADVTIAKRARAVIGVNNVIDKDPPPTSLFTSLSNGNTFPQTYDALGRYFYLALKIDYAR